MLYYVIKNKRISLIDKYIYAKIVKKGKNLIKK